MLDEARARRLIGVGRSLVSELDPEGLFARLLEEARALTGARYAALGILDRDRRELERFVTSGIDPQTHAAIGELPRGRGVLGELIRDPRPLRLSEVGEHPRSYGFPPGHPPMHSFLGAPILIRGEAFGNLYLTEKEGGDFDAADEETLVVLTDWAAIAIENARLYQSVERRRGELERAVAELEATTAVTRAIGADTDLEHVLELIVKRGRALIEARLLVIALREGEDLVVGATAGELATDLHGARFPIEASISGRVMRSGRPERISDISSSIPFRLGEPGLRAEAGLMVPLVYRGQTLGVLSAFDRLEDGPQFGAEDERLLLAFAASAATAVAIAKSVAEERLRQTLAAAEHERGRWARELHDETLQGLGALRVGLSSALRSGRPGAVDDAARRAVGQIETEIGALRSLIADLRPAALDEIGLAAAVEGLVEQVGSHEGLRVEAEVDLGPRNDFAPELQTTVYRLLQESLTNVVKHAEAGRVAIQVVARDGRVHVRVEDDGRGFDPAAHLPGFGLLGMSERATLAGGIVSVSSSPGAGTTVRAELPTSPESGSARLAG